MRDEPLPHEKLPGSTEEWRYDISNNPKAISRHQAADFYNASQSGSSEGGGDAGIVAIFVMPFVIGIVLVGLAFLPFFWFGVFFAESGWSINSMSKLIAIPIVLWGALLCRQKLAKRSGAAPGQSSRRPYQHESALRSLWRKSRLALAAGRPASLGDALMIAFAGAFAWYAFSGNAEGLERVGPEKSDARHMLVNLGLDVVNLPLWVVHEVPKVAKGIKGIKTVSIPLFTVALNSLFWATPVALVLWPALRIVQRMKRR